MDTIKLGCGSAAAPLADSLAASLQQHRPSFTAKVTVIGADGKGDPVSVHRQLEKALQSREIDLAVFHFRDLPLELRDHLPLLAVSQRAEARDALVYPKDFDCPDFSKPIGCANRRQLLQLQRAFPDCIAVPAPGGLAEKLQRLDRGEYGALTAAACDLQWSGLQHRIGRILELEELYPPACQGIIAVQGREESDASLLECFHSWDSWDAALAEREFFKALQGEEGPVAVYAKAEGKQLSVCGLYVDEAEGIYRTGSMQGDRADARRLGYELSAELKIG